MKAVFKLRHTFVATALLLAAFHTSALTLGRSRGAVLVGQPLDVRIDVRLDQGDDPASLCFDADVFHADSRIDAARVSVAVDASAAAQSATVRVRSSAPVDEPVVTIYLRAGCAQKFTRRYVFLADVLPEGTQVPAVAAAVAASTSMAVPATAAQAVPARPVRPVPPAAAPPGEKQEVAPAPANPSAAQERAAARRAAREQQRAQAREAQGQPPAAVREPRPASPVSVVRRKVQTPVASRSRLQLDPLDLAAERDPTLRASTEMLTQPADNDQRRAEAAAMWRAINAKPEDILRDTQRIQTLETDVRGLRESSVKTKAAIVDLKAQLQQAESERYANALVYSLVALLVAALALAAYLWRSGRAGAWSGRDWWRELDLAGERADERGQGPDSLLPSSGRGLSKPSTPAVDVDLDVNEEMFASLKTAPTAVTSPSPPARPATLPPLEHSDFAASIPGVPRAVNAEELFDIQQQADFFVSLGQYDQAIEVLKNHIGDNVETSALAYLDLLKIYHTLGRQDEYRQLRADFNRGFNAQAPVWEAFSEASSGLEAYQKALSRIESLWPSPKVLEIIEESIFRKPGYGEGEAFDLEAYRELLLLYSIAKEIVEQGGSAMDFEFSSGGMNEGDSGPPRSQFSSTNIQPLSASLPPISMTADPMSDIVLPRPSPRLGLDIDLTEEPSSAFLEPEVSDGQSHPGHDDKDRPSPRSLLGDIDLFDDSTERDIAPRKPSRQ